MTERIVAHKPTPLEMMLAEQAYVIRSFEGAQGIEPMFSPTFTRRIHTDFQLQGLGNDEGTYDVGGNAHAAESTTDAVVDEAATTETIETKDEK